MSTVNVFIGLATNRSNKGAYSMCLRTDNGVFSFPPILVCESKITESRLTCLAIRDFFEKLENAEGEMPEKVIFYTTSDDARSALLFSGFDQKCPDKNVAWREITEKAKKMNIEIDIKGKNSILLKLSQIENARAKKVLRLEAAR